MFRKRQFGNQYICHLLNFASNPSNGALHGTKRGKPVCYAFGKPVNSFREYFSRWIRWRLGNGPYLGQYFESLYAICIRWSTYMIGGVKYNFLTSYMYTALALSCSHGSTSPKCFLPNTIPMKIICVTVAYKYVLPLLRLYEFHPVTNIDFYALCTFGKTVWTLD